MLFSYYLIPLNLYCNVMHNLLRNCWSDHLFFVVSVFLLVIVHLSSIHRTSMIIASCAILCNLIICVCAFILHRSKFLVEWWFEYHYLDKNGSVILPWSGCSFQSLLIFSTSWVQELWQHLCCDKSSLPTLYQCKICLW